MKIVLGFAVVLLSLSCFAHPSVGIVLDSKGNVYYSDLKQVWKINTHGKKSIVVPNVHTHELYIDKDDNLYGEHLWYNGEAADTWGHFVWKLSAVGKYEKVIPDTEGFLTNYGFVRDQQGNMYVANRDSECQKVTRVNTNGTLTILGDVCMENIRWMSVTADGVVYLIDLYDLKRVDANGHVTRVATQLQESSWIQFFIKDTHSIMGLTTDKHENVYATVPKGMMIKRIAKNGSVSVFTETATPWAPTGIAVAPNGDCWILESYVNTVRVERISKDGKRTIF